MSSKTASIFAAAKRGSKKRAAPGSSRSGSSSSSKSLATPAKFPSRFRQTKSSSSSASSSSSSSASPPRTQSKKRARDDADVVEIDDGDEEDEEDECLPLPSKLSRSFSREASVPGADADATPGASPMKNRGAAIAAQDADDGVQAFIHLEVNYQRRRDDREHLTAHQVSTLEFVESHFRVPEDIESTKFGPLSGDCFEERVLVAYAWNLLAPLGGKKGGKTAAAAATFEDLKMCDRCGEAGHVRLDCQQC